ncbi:MAG: DUF427 domain-containing protein [Myxococcales bacterium]
MAKAIWNGAVVAESDDCEVVEGNQYFPPGSVEKRYLRESATRSTCPWKGEASYYTLEVDGERNEDSAWTYLAPTSAAAKIRGYVAFWHGVEVKV